MSGVPGMHDGLPNWAPELRPCGTTAAYRRHQRRGEPVCDACHQADKRATQDRIAANGGNRPGRPLRTHYAASDGTTPACGQDCGTRTTTNPDQVTCQRCLTRLPASAERTAA